MELNRPADVKKLLQILRDNGVSKCKLGGFEVEFSHEFSQPQTLELDELIEEVDPAYQAMKDTKAKESPLVDDTNRLGRSSEYDIYTSMKELSR